MIDPESIIPVVSVTSCALARFTIHEFQVSYSIRLKFEPRSGKKGVYEEPGYRREIFSLEASGLPLR